MINNANVFNISMPNELTVDTVVDSYSQDEFVKFGKNNMFPQEAAKLCRESVSHRAIINSKVIFAVGNGFDGDDAEDTDEVGLPICFKRSLIDNEFFGNIYIEVVTDSRRSFLKLFHFDASKVRVGKGGGFVVHPNWSRYRYGDGLSKNYSEYPNFKSEKGLFRSLIHIKSYEPEFSHYGLPGWYAGLRSAIIIRQTNEWNRSELANNFSISGILSVPGVNSVEEAKLLDAKFKSFSGAEKAGKVLPHYLRDLGAGETREKMEFIDFTKDRSGNWLDLHRQSDDDLIKVHNWYKSLAAFTENTGFDTQRIINDYKMASATIIPEMRNKILNVVKEVMTAFGYGVDFNIIDKSPISEVYNTDFVWEVRKKQGMPYDENDPKQQIFYAELMKGGGNVNS